MRGRWNSSGRRSKSWSIAQMREPEPPLRVDLDGSLIHTDLLLESALNLLQRNPLYAFAFVYWLLNGKARLKKEIAKRAAVDVSTLPYDMRVLDYARTESAHRRVVLCTAADDLLAEAVAGHLGCFAS